MNRKTRRTEAQRAASRANGAKSQGPVTPEGKAISSQNATMHAFDAARLCTAFEDVSQLDALISDYTVDLQPANSVEADLIHQMAFAQFRLNRIQLLETTFFNFEIFETKNKLIEQFEDPPCNLFQHAAFKLLMKREPIKAMAMIDRYEARYRRAYDRALAALRNLQKDRQRTELHELKLERERRKLNIADKPSGDNCESLRNEPEPNSQAEQNTGSGERTEVSTRPPALFLHPGNSNLPQHRNSDASDMNASLTDL